MAWQVQVKVCGIYPSPVVSRLTNIATVRSALGLKQAARISCFGSQDSPQPSDFGSEDFRGKRADDRECQPLPDGIIASTSDLVVDFDNLLQLVDLVRWGELAPLQLANLFLQLLDFVSDGRERFGEG